MILVLMVGGLFAKTLEREANELGVDAETKFNGKDYIAAGETFEQAIAKYNEAVTTDNIPMDNEKVGRWLEHAFNSYFKGKDFENAIRILEIRAEKNPTDYKIVNYQAIIFKKYLKQYDKAVEVLVNYNSAKRSYKVEKKIAGIYLDQENYEKALEWYTKAYELKKDSTVIQNIASLNLKLDRKSDAVKAYSDFLLTNPNEATLIKTYRNMGGLYESMNDQANTIKYFEKSNALKYQLPLSLNLVVKYYDKKDYDSANKNINKILANDSSNADAIYYRASIKYDTGDKVGAKADFEKILSNAKYSSVAKGFIESIESE